MSKRYKMPTVKQFLQKKRIYDEKKDPVWVYLEREMRENLDKKPYNEKVGEWLKFLKDLRFYFYCEGKGKKRRLQREVGPSWYIELSSQQREVLRDFKHDIHKDLLEDLPVRTQKALNDLGLTLRIPSEVLMTAMKDSVDDPGIFIWDLYIALYKKSPSELRPKYDMNAMLLMSSLVFIDLEECINELEKLTHYDEPPHVPKKKVTRKEFTPEVRYGEYLQKRYATCHLAHRDEEKKEKILPLGYKFRLRSEPSYEKLCNDSSFLEKRKSRNMREKQVERICTYKFWEPPSTLRNTDPKMAAYVNKLKMIKNKAKIRVKAPFKNVHYLVQGVSYTGGHPHFVLQNIGLLPTGYIPINGGIMSVNGEYVTNIIGFWKFPRRIVQKCEEKCECLVKWEGKVMDYVKESKCKCGHLFDYYHEGKNKDKYFHPPNKHGPHWFDRAKIYQMDPTEDFVKDTIRDALMSRDQTPEASNPTISAAGLKTKDLLAALLADLSDKPLLIPHLPQANLLNNLQEWVRKRVRGKLTPKEHRQMILQSQRRWLDLKHMDFRARAFRIPFTLKQLEHMYWNQRNNIQKLFEKLLNNFVYRNRLKQVQQTRLWWSTTKYDQYPSKAFLDIFFTYMPTRMKDTFLINPYNSELTPKSGAKTCPL